MAHRAFKPEYFDRMLRLAKTQAVFFAFGFDAKGAAVFLLDEELDGKSLFTRLKSESGAKKGGYGRASLASGTLSLACEQTTAGMARALREQAKEHGWAAKKFILTDPSGRALGEEAAPGGGNPPAGTPEQVKSALALAIENSKGPPKIPAYPVTPFDNEALAQMDDETLREQDLTVREPNELFTGDYMDALVGLKMKGANQPGLKAVMRRLEKGVSGKERAELIAKLAPLRGRDAEELDAEYGRFLVLRKQQGAVRKAKGIEGVEAVNETLHGDFTGSNPQLVYGKVVGDAYGIDPVFGALLNPTGGMVGPGNIALHLDDDDPTGYHGIVHDAAGYMYNYHNQGPGYNYLGSESRDTADPLTGQQSGMKYWHEKLDPGVTTTMLGGAIDLCYGLKDAFTEIGRGVNSAVKAVGQGVGDVLAKAEKAAKTVRDEVGGAIALAMKTAATGGKTAATRLEKTAQDVAKGAARAAGAARQGGVTAVGRAEETVRSTGQDVADKLNAARDFLWN